MLFASGNIVRGMDIADVLNVDEKEVKGFIQSINTRFDEENRPITIREIDDGFQMCTKPKYHEYIKKIQEKGAVSHSYICLSLRLVVFIRRIKHH